MSLRTERLEPTSPDVAVDAALVDVVVATSDDETFLFAYVANLRELGVFVRTEHPLPIGTRVTLGFEASALVLQGEVAWINPVRNDDNPNPGMGVRLLALDLDKRDQVVALVRAIAYLDDPADAN